MKKFLWLLFIGMLFFSCAEIEEMTQYGFGKNSQIENSKTNEYLKEYTVIGEDKSLMQAVNKAKILAIKKAVVDIIGLYNEQTNQQKLKYNLYNTEAPNKWVVNDKLNLLQKSKPGSVYICKIKIPVKMEELKNTLQELGVSSEAENLQQELVRKNKTKDPVSNMRDAQSVLDEAREKAGENENTHFLKKYIDNMTYMVFKSEKTNADRFLLKSGIETANGYLLKEGYRAIDAGQIEKLKKDDLVVFQESSNDRITPIQIIAQKLNADVYMELDSECEGGIFREGEKGYYGSAKITLKIFNPSTGELLGSVPYSSPKTFSKISSYDAQSNAIQSTVYKALPIAIDQAKIIMAKAYANGIRYELIINDTPDSKSMARFRRKLSERVSGLKTIHQSKAQTKYEVFLFGSIDDLEAIVYDISDIVVGFENLELVVLRGKSVIFKSGF